MIFHYLYEMVLNNDIDVLKELFRVLAYIERSAALDTVSFILDKVSEARKKGLTIEDIEYMLSDLYTSLEAEKQILIQNDPVLSLADAVIKRAEETRKSKAKESGQAST